MSWRKSWPKLNIYGSTGDGKCTKRLLLPDERSVWDDYLDMAQVSPCRGRICISFDIGYTIDQLSKILRTPPEIIKRAEKRMVDLKMLTVDSNRVISPCNWKKYQSEYSRQLHYRVTGRSDTKVAPIERDTERDTERDVEKNSIVFKAPTTEEVSLYCKERKNDVDPDRFINHYQAKGWFIGRNKMKDWRAAVRTWEKKESYQYEDVK